MKTFTIIIVFVFFLVPLAKSQDFTDDELQDIKRQIAHKTMVFNKYHQVIGSGKENGRRVSKARMQYLINQVMRLCYNEQVKMQFGTMLRGRLIITTMKMRAYLYRLATRSYYREAWFDFAPIVPEDIDLSKMVWNRSYKAYIVKTPLVQKFHARYSNGLSVKDTTNKEAEFRVRIHLDSDEYGNRLIKVTIGDFKVKSIKIK